ncbi:MAG: hypothetical protein OSB09_09710, partial [Planctomycetota bacterium]|nr:hypothetical protein [Planctomycetota bacterium]
MNSRSNLANLAAIFMLTLTLLIHGCGTSNYWLTPDEPAVRQPVAGGEVSRPSMMISRGADTNGLSAEGLSAEGL